MPRGRVRFSIASSIRIYLSFIVYTIIFITEKKIKITLNNMTHCLTTIFISLTHARKHTLRLKNETIVRQYNVYNNIDRFRLRVKHSNKLRVYSEQLSRIFFYINNTDVYSFSIYNMYLQKIIIFHKQCVLSKSVLYKFQYLEFKFGFYDLWLKVHDSDEKSQKK